MGSKDWAIQLDVSILFSLFFTYFGMKLMLALGLVTLYLVGCWAAEESKEAANSNSLAGHQPDSVSHAIEKRTADNTKNNNKSRKVQKKLRKQRRRKSNKNARKRSKGKKPMLTKQRRRERISGNKTKRQRAQ